MTYSIDRAKAGDETILAQILTASWKTAFGSILSAEALAARADTARAEQGFKRLLSQKTGAGYVMRVEGVPHAMAWWDAAREAALPGYAEMICIHSLPGGWGRGHGRKLMEQVLADMTQAGYGRVMLWVFEENHRARRFYEALGFRPNGMCKNTLGSPEIGYEKRL